MADVTAAERDRVLLDAGWPRVADHLLRGIGHDLNNRVQTLLSLVQLLQLDEEVTPLIPFLEKEVSQLEEVVTLLRLIPGDPNEEEELISLPEFLPPLVALHNIQKGLEPVRRSYAVEAADLMPVRAPWTHLGRCALLFMAAAGEEALRRDRTLELHVYADAGDAVFEARAEGGLNGGPEPRTTTDPHGLQALFDTLGARLEETGEEALRIFRLRIPAAIRPG
jgi:hypothetical protein